MLPRKIHLIRAGQAKPFVETASRLGAPVRVLARRAHLPLQSVLDGEGVIGEHALWRFVELASTFQGCEQLGYLTALDHPINRTGQLGGMTITRAQSLIDILEIFCKDVMAESDGSRYRLVTRDGETWFTRALMFEDSSAAWQAEQYVLTFIIQIIRLCAPGDWLPRRIRIAARKTPAVLPAEWRSIRADWGQPRTELLIDNDVLGLASRLPPAVSPLSSDITHTMRNTMMIQDLVDRQIWSGQIGLNHAAQELGMSISTLKRRLVAMHTSYSKILIERRMHHAVRLLEESDMSVGKMANALGYSAVSNFSRAFRKATGTSPAGRRKQ